MSLLKSLCSAFLMYSRIPFPKVEWKEENRRYALCFFPLIGAVIAIVIILWYNLCELLEIGNLLFSVGCTVIPILITGGIHLDGYCDVSDAVSSYADREKKLDIMKDSHIGAFAVIRLVTYLLLQTAVFSELRVFRPLLIFTCCMIQSRAWSALAAITFPNARSSGSLQSFTKTAHKGITIVAEFLWLTVSTIFMIAVNMPTAIAVTISGIAVFAYYYRFSKKNFGGITGDVAGWFVQIFELFTALIIVIFNLIFK